MLVEFLPAHGFTGPLIRLYNWADGEVALLYDVAVRLASGETGAVELHRLPFIRAVGDLTFTWVADATRDRGVLLPLHDGRDFELRLMPESWAEVAHQIEPFTRTIIGFQWLLHTTEVEVLLSWSGQW